MPGQQGISTEEEFGVGSQQIRPTRNALPRKFHGATQTQGIGREAHGNSLTVPSLAEHAPAARPARPSRPPPSGRGRHD